MGAAALPCRAAQRGADRVDQAAVGIGDDQPHPGQAAGGQGAGTPASRRRPLRGDVQAEDFALPVAVDPDRDQGVHVDGAAVLADLDGQRVDPHERVRAGIQRPVTKRLHLRVEVRRHLRDLRLGQAARRRAARPASPPAASTPPAGTRGHHRDQRLLGPATVLQQPIREVRAGAQLRNRQLHRAGPGIPAPAR